MNQVLGMLIDAATLVAATSYALSAAVAVAARFGAPSERRAWWNVLLPPLGGLAVVALGFGSAIWDAWMVTPDHCGDRVTHEPYLCWLHPAGTVGFSPIETLAVLVLLVAGAITASRLVAWARATRRIAVMVDHASPQEAARFRGVLAEAGVRWRGPITVVRSDEPICGVTGWRQPRLLVSTAIAERLRPAEIGVMIEHERAHVQRRDPLRRLVAHLARVAHLPGLGKRAVDAWTLAAEVECDRAAARACGSRVQVAETLVRFRRAVAQQPDQRLAGAVSAFAGAV
jgi:Zn-dependent protease with chaperone function